MKTDSIFYLGISSVPYNKKCNLWSNPVYIQVPGFCLWLAHPAQTHANSRVPQANGSTAGWANDRYEHIIDMKLVFSHSISLGAGLNHVRQPQDRG